MADWDKAWGRVADALEDCAGIAWDTCHKIYILKDDKQFEKMGEYGYDTLIHSNDMSAAEMLATVKTWYEDSCFLKFIDSVKTKKDGTDKWKSLIEQGYDDYWEGED